MSYFKLLKSISNLGKFRYNHSFIRISSNLTSLRVASNWSKVKEIQIPVPYGFIAAKAWGNENAEPVLALHGWQDNVGTFDKLIPLLSSDLYIVAVDSPGHGLSSHKPKGTFYHYMEMLVDVKRVINYLKWQSFNIIGHSVGGTIGLLYSSIFPEQIKNLVLLDVIRPGSRATELLPNITREGIESLLMIENKDMQPSKIYNLEDAKARLIAGMGNQITEESASILMKRGVKSSDCGTGVVFTRDLRVKMTEDLQKFSHDNLKAFMKRLKCNLIIILGKQSFIYQYKTPEVNGDFLKLYEENCESFQLIYVEGNHFVHLNNPDRVAPHVDNFFKTHIPEINI